ncbi:GyrI-like domain-containing protein [Brachyspira hyodysenteriae]|uniref:GyrI-like domain-containing protein n=1 Tax=Brachyspira hyodysenteriae TaxID=159 RepID=UPI00063DC5EB|nr:GyrI-like domain-containing protein [Brachyspira hyodysenteriae]KLI15991.1 effector-binding domain-containing protein [Brachyspira hyodysenteriae]KLI57081.1 effector-binding domain-containing protein [Brachyspira hyodysenteriae]
MDIEIVEKEDFEVIGKVAEGESEKHSKWVLPLWQEFNKNVKEIINLVKVDENNNLSGIWGIMNDVNETFAPWGERGKYMAGVEVKENSLPPEGWIKWNINGGKFIKVKCNIENYSKVFTNIVENYAPKNGYTIIGNVMEYYIPNSKDFYLFFNIKGN